MLSRRNFLSLTTAGAVAAGLAGCGSSGPSKAGSGKEMAASPEPSDRSRDDRLTTW